MKKWEDEQRKKAHMRRVIEAKPTLSKRRDGLTRFRDTGLTNATRIIQFWHGRVIRRLQTDWINKVAGKSEQFSFRARCSF